MHLAFYMVSGGPHSGPHVFTESRWPTEPFLKSTLFTTSACAHLDTQSVVNVSRYYTLRGFPLWVTMPCLVWEDGPVPASYCSGRGAYYRWSRSVGFAHFFSVNLSQVTSIIFNIRIINKNLPWHLCLLWELCHLFLTNGFTLIVAYTPTCHRSRPCSLFLLLQVPHLRRHRAVICGPGKGPGAPLLLFGSCIYWFRLLFCRLSSYILESVYKPFKGKVTSRFVSVGTRSHITVLFLISVPAAPTPSWNLNSGKPGSNTWVAGISMYGQVNKEHTNMCFSFYWAHWSHLKFQYSGSWC